MNAYQATAQLRRAHSHRCPECGVSWGCTSGRCTTAHYSKHCPTHNPDYVTCDKGRHWLLDTFAGIERIETPRTGVLRLHYRDEGRAAEFSNPKQVHVILQRLLWFCDAANPYACRLWAQLYDAATRAVRS